MNIRPTAVAGTFYPGEAPVLQDWLQQTLLSKQYTQKNSSLPRALIVPHAGYVYSGQIAAHAFRLWRDADQKIRTVVIMGPAHRVGFYGMATIDFDALATPLGTLKVDTELRVRLLNEFEFLQINNYAHAPEHSLEVMLPFLRSLLPAVKVLPLLNGSLNVDEVKSVLEKLWQQEGVYFVISSDLSHFHPYSEAQSIDAETAAWIENKQWPNLDGNHACGYKGIQGLLAMNQAERLKIDPIERLNSGDTAGSKDSVVGYGSWAIYEKMP